MSLMAGWRGVLGEAGKRDWTLRRQLITLLILFTVGPLLLTNAWGYLQSRSNFERVSLRNAHNIAALEATAVFRLVHEQFQLVSLVVAGNQDLFGLLRALANKDEEAREAVRGALQAHLLAKQHEGHAIDEFFILSPEGRLVVSSLGLPATLSDESTSLCFLRGRQVAAIDGVDWITPQAELLISAPIHDTNDTFLGVLCAHIHIQLRYSQVDSPTEASPTTIYLVDSKGRVIANDSQDPAAIAPGQSLGAEVGWTFGSERWEGRYDDRDDGVLAAYVPVTELGWGIVVETPTQAALGMFDRLRWQALLFGGFVTALAVLAAIAVARRIARPVTALSEAARQAAAGSLGVSVPPGGTVEVRRLASSFNRMSAAVKESHELLEQRIAERTKELQASQEFSERLLDSIDQPVVVIGRSLAVVRANQAAMRRYGADVIGRSYGTSLACRAQPCLDCPVRATFESSRPGLVERVERVGDVEDVVALQTFPVLAADGEVEAVIQLRRVVTNERHMQAQMVHQEKMSAFGIMAAGVAHEIGNPLAAIHSQLTLAQMAPAPGRTEETIAIVSREVERIGRLLRELVSFTRRREAVPVLVSVEQVARDVVRLIQHDPRAHGVAIEVVAQPNVAPVRGMEDDMIQVLLNLGLNALDAMPDGGALIFETGTNDGFATLRIRDRGRGVSEAARLHLFDPFFTTKAPGRGTGLGLFVSKGIVERMGGELVLESTGPEGTVFLVSLPVASGWGNGAPS